MGSWTHKPEKRAANKVERQAAKREVPQRLDDDYTYEEFMADICTPEEPCELCQRRALATPS